MITTRNSINHVLCGYRNGSIVNCLMKLITCSFLFSTVFVLNVMCFFFFTLLRSVHELNKTLKEIRGIISLRRWMLLSINVGFCGWLNFFFLSQISPAQDKRSICYRELKKYAQLLKVIDMNGAPDLRLGLVVQPVFGKWSWLMI